MSKNWLPAYGGMVAGMAVIGLAAFPAQGEVIEVPASGGTLASGFQVVNRLGQTFTAPEDPVLTSLTFYQSSINNFADPDFFSYRVKIAAWDGDRPSSELLYTSELFTGRAHLPRAVTEFPVTLTGIDALLTPGGVYVFYLDLAMSSSWTVGSEGAEGNIFLGAPLELDPYGGGMFVSFGSDELPPGSGSGQAAWTTVPLFDLSFKATFIAVPEPSGPVGAIAGSALILGRRRRGRAA